MFPQPRRARTPARRYPAASGGRRLVREYESLPASGGLQPAQITNIRPAIGDSNYTCIRCKIYNRDEGWRITGKGLPGSGPVTTPRPRIPNGPGGAA
jgi:hypothetical protein